MRAIFQGEFHTSRSDEKALHSHVTEEVDAVFEEQREDSVRPEEWTIGYAWFMLGISIYFWLQAVLSRASDDQEYGVPVHDEIDMRLPDFYDIIPDSWKLIAGLLSVPFFLVGLYIPRFTVPYLVLPVEVSLLYTAIAKPIVVLGAPLLFSFILIFIEEKYIGARDEEMAKNITQISTENGYENVVISCGDAHLKRLPELLEERGWVTEKNRSELSLGSRIWHWGMKD